MKQFFSVNDPVYLDYNATTPVYPAVLEAMRPFLEQHFGNPSSIHAFGAPAKSAVANARNKVAELLECNPEEIIFTSGGTESNNMAIIGIARAHQRRDKHIIISAIEHPAVLNVCAYLEKSGFRVTRLPVDRQGRVAPEDLENAIQEDTVLVSVMHANNEVGTVQPINELTEIAHSHDIMFHTDAAQSVGKIPVRIPELDVDLLSIAGHKIYAPKGIGILYKRKEVEVENILFGAGQEMGYRPGTENVPYIAAIGKACEIISEKLPKYSNQMRKLRDLIENELLERVPEIIVNSRDANRLPNTASISVKGVLATDVIKNLTLTAISAGAACHTDLVEASHVLQAMQVPEEYINGTLRISTGRFTTIKQVEKAVIDISETITKLRSLR